MKRITATVAALLLYATASAYEEETHEEFTESTVKQNEYIQHTLGFDLSETFTYIDRDGNPDNQTLEEIRIRGSFREDDGTRPLNHFYDPNDNSGMIGLPTPDWALEDTQQNGWNVETSQQEDMPCCIGQNYSLHDAREYLYKALTETDLDVRKENRMKHFYSMGHVLHLIADMAQPEHGACKRDCVTTHY